MTISSEVRKVGPFSGNGVTTAFPFAFKVFKAADVRAVKVNTSTGIETTLVLTTDYTVSLNPDQNTNPGGTITMLTALPTGETLVITSALQNLQPTALTNAGAFYPTVINDALDRVTILVQQLATELDRTLTLPITTSSVSTALPRPEAGKVIGWNDSATGLVNRSATDLAGSLVYGNWQYDTFTGDAATTTFALTGNPQVVGNMDVSVNGETMVPVADYNLLGTNVVFTTAPADDAEILVRYGDAAIQGIINQEVLRYVATAGQTVFTVGGGYPAGENALAVYVNGLRMEGGGVDYTETDSTTITFSGGLTDGDTVVVVVGRETGGGGSGSATLGGVAIPDFIINQDTSGGYKWYPETNPVGWNSGAGRMSVQFELTSTNYYSANPDGHWAVSLRQDAGLLGSDVTGQGIAVGNATGFPGGASDLNPTALLETFFLDSASEPTGDNFLWSASEVARLYPMQDGQRYKFIIDSTMTNDGNRYLRYRMWRYISGTWEWRAEVDTGDVLDHNVSADLTQSGLLFAHVFASDLTSWQLAFSSVRVTWGPAENAVPDMTTKVSRFGARMLGDTWHLGTGQRTFVNNDGTNASNWSAFQSRTNNSGTSVAALPRGSSTVSNFSAFNNSHPGGGSYRAVTYGIDGVDAVIETFHSGQADPGLKVNIGAGNTVAKYTTTGLQILGASRNVGQLIASYGSMTNWGSTNAKGFTDAEALNIDQICTDGYIRTLMSSTPTNAQVEVALRPLYCIVSTLIKELKDKKVI